MSNSTRNWLTVAFVFIAACGGVLRLESAQESRQPQAQKWEYRQVFIRPGDVNRQLNDAGDGWEIFDVEVTPGSSGSAYAYCRRPAK